MTEQDRPKESQVQFPKVNYDTIDRLHNFVEENLPQFLDDTLRIIEKKDPDLKDLLFLIAAELEGEERSEALLGGFFTYRALEKMRNSLPPVSKETIRTFYVELASCSLNEAELQEESESFRQKVKELKFEAVSAPHPKDYAEENPYLIVYIAAIGIEPENGYINRFGQVAMSVYELKRRQFFADQLKKQFGE